MGRSSWRRVGICPRLCSFPLDVMTQTTATGRTMVGRPGRECSPIGKNLNWAELAWVCHLDPGPWVPRSWQVAYTAAVRQAFPDGKIWGHCFYVHQWLEKDWLNPAGTALAGDRLLLSLLLEASLSLSVGAFCLQEERLLELFEIVKHQGGGKCHDALSEGRATSQHLVLQASVLHWVP